jgi:hypothetical protein
MVNALLLELSDRCTLQKLINLSGHRYLVCAWSTFGSLSIMLHMTLVDFGTKGLTTLVLVLN